MRVLCLGDTQIANHKAMGGPVIAGLNRRCREILQAIDMAVTAAKNTYDIKAVVQVGDFFDIARPSPALYMAVIELICKHDDVMWHIMAGNHDIASYDSPTAIAPLATLPNVRIYEKPTITLIGEKVWQMIPYTGPECATAIKQALEDPVLARNVFCVHYAYTGKGPQRPDTFSCAFIPEETIKNSATWLFGHEHGSAHATVHRTSSFRSLGSFCDFDFGSGCSIYHRCAIYDTEDRFSISALERIWGPTFADMSDTPFENSTCINELAKGATPLYLRVSPASAEQAEMLKRARIIADYTVHTPSTTPVTLGDASAAQVILGGPEGSYTQAVAQELDESSYGPEDQAEIWDLCSRMMRMK